MPPGQRGRGRGCGNSFGRGGGGGRGSSRGSGRGSGRGGGRSGGRGGRGSGSGIRSFENRPKGNHPKFPAEVETISDEENADPHSFPGSDDDDDASSIISTDSEPEEAVTKPYSALLQSLTSSKKPAEDENSARKSKRRKLEHAKAEDVQEVSWISEDDEAEEEIPEADSEGEGEDDTSDPFEAHFASPTPTHLSSVKEAENNSWESKKLTHPSLLGRVHITTPTGSQTPAVRKIDTQSDLHLKSKLTTAFLNLNGELTPLQKALAPYISAYKDLQFNSRTVTNAAELRNLTCLHALNHIYKTRDRVLKNNARLSRGGPEAEDLELRDQGFTRPKALFILPTRNACAELVETIISLSQPEQQENKKRFLDTFTLTEQSHISEQKPEDFRALFKGNNDDLFRFGVKFTRKSVKLFSRFYSSDIVIASPLGLRMAIGSEGDKGRDYDFLSSLEVVVVDQAEALLMQNWDHIEYVFKHLNLIPKDAHGCDFGRVRSWYLDGHAKYLRQTIVLSGFVTPELNSLFTGFMRNISGRVKTQPEYKGTLTDLGLQVRQTFTRFDTPTPSSDPNSRFKFFTSTLLPGVLRAASSRVGGTLVFIPSYYDFIRVRNHLETLPLPFGVVSEETSVSGVARARSHFLTGRYPVLLYTGRAHHFRRYVMRGATSVVFYQLPDNPVFYKEVAGGFLLRSIEGGEVDVGACKVSVVFSRWDAMRLERVVGSGRVRVMCTDVGDTFEFV